MTSNMNLRSTDPLELLQQINLIRLDDRMSWVEQNTAILNLIKERDQMHSIKQIASR